VIVLHRRLSHRSVRASYDAPTRPHRHAAHQHHTANRSNFGDPLLRFSPPHGVNMPNPSRRAPPNDGRTILPPTPTTVSSIRRASISLRPLVESAH
jgi:hypothetical protein